ncbi:hypothetical protein TcasGA2_TC001343 [Tribolium castaneum]|uniref:Uncharacterized protein n=1 Tax=Tribolium castaneum TaxID=7070 RepID=D6WC93_TRICA|nr:hypothetical protein TcasGA2_TC001343 [Tribolium castaneum]
MKQEWFSRANIGYEAEADSVAPRVSLVDSERTSEIASRRILEDCTEVKLLPFDFQVPKFTL